MHRGASGVLAGAGRRFPLVRAVTPRPLRASRVTRLPYRRIAPCSAVAALLWAGAEAGIGYAAPAAVG
ncbi:hypothetical protein ABZ281_36115 [Streptomyces sp. NPDC006265]|uniref:hypothetical protein n=1 Tax=Streptomyces sp. NPDC006265 TaxID=3156740 RepID=UPI0033B30320